MNKDRQRLTLPGFILVPSALAGLTSLFGMGRGDPRRYSHLKVFVILSVGDLPAVRQLADHLKDFKRAGTFTGCSDHVF